MTEPRSMNLVTALRLNLLPPPVVIVLVGAGGKTTFMHRLAKDVQGRSWRALFTTTTRLWAHQFAALPNPHLATTPQKALTLAARAKPGEALALASKHLPEEAKVQGIPAAWVDMLAEDAKFDLIVVEADGSREKLLKAPSAGEPVVPARASLFVSMASWQVVGKPLSPHYVHRPERVADLTGIALGQPITPEALVRLLAHPQGGLKECPPGARVLWCINGVDSDALASDVVPVARRLLEQPREKMLRSPVPPEVLIASLRADVPVRAVVGRVAAIVLAAGAGTRFGGPKQVALWQGRPLIHHVLDAVAASQVDEIVVVVGAHAARVRQAVRAWQQQHPLVRLRVVLNREWAKGQSTSVKVGLRAAGAVSAALFPLADQPLVSASLLNMLIATHRRTLAGIVRPRYAGQPGAPVLFDHALFGELMELTGDTGGRAVVQTHAREVVYVDWEDARAGWDVDTRQDLLDSTGEA